MALHSIPGGTNKATKTGSKSRSLPDSAWPLCCTLSDEDHLTPLRAEKESSGKKHRCRHDGDDREWFAPRSLLTVSQTHYTVSFTMFPLFKLNAIKPVLYIVRINFNAYCLIN